MLAARGATSLPATINDVSSFFPVRLVPWLIFVIIGLDSCLFYWPISKIALLFKIALNCAYAASKNLYFNIFCQIASQSESKSISLLTFDLKYVLNVVYICCIKIRKCWQWQELEVARIGEFIECGEKCRVNPKNRYPSCSRREKAITLLLLQGD